jgi:hypothetical protein
MSGHTPEPWGVCGPAQDGSFILTPPDFAERADEEWTTLCAFVDDEADAYRIVACVNALAGIPDPAAFVKAARELLAQSEATIDHVEDADVDRVQNQCTLCFTYRKNLRDKIDSFRAADPAGQRQ